MVARSETPKKALRKCSGFSQSFEPAKIELVDAGVDWITVTCRDPARRSLLEQCAVAQVEVQASRGEKVKPWSFEGYQGLSAGEASYGKREDDDIFRLSGPTAWAHWRRAYELSDNCSRIDVQVTVRITAHVPDVIEGHHIEALDHYKSWKRKPEVNLWKSNNGSDTLYLNKRISDQYGRIYDKGVESKLDHYERCLRYEVEYKGKASKLVALKLSQVTDVAPRALALCYAFLRKHGLTPWLPATTGLLIQVPRSRPDDRRRIAWLRKAVCPSVATLIERGKLEDVIEALGLVNHVVQVRN